MRSQIVLADFVGFCEKNPDLRFWQALAAWTGSDVFLSKGVLPTELLEKNKSLVDPFYFESKLK